MPNDPAHTPAQRQALRRLRLIGIAEGISYLVLLGIAMPLKYLAGMPLMVTLTGSVHGALFVGFGLAALHVQYLLRWHWTWLIQAFLASVIPLGTFWLDHVRLRPAMNG
ncbi:MAG: DUF3817 domain-containing protein [Bacteroidia bacterium]|nr:DUF3817 domain-containing protein [Bacteroidia bacterium]